MSKARLTMTALAVLLVQHVGAGGSTAAGPAPIGAQAGAPQGADRAGAEDEADRRG